MQLHICPPAADWEKILMRPAMDLTQLEAPVSAILQEVATRGDDALLDFTARFDGVRLANLAVGAEEIALAETFLSEELKSAIRQAAQNIERFHAAQRDEIQVVETMPGVRCWRKSVGIERVGLYIPGGTAPLFSSVLMLAIPARLAGCREVVLCTPPQKDGTVHPAILFAAQLTGIQRVFRVGGAQAIGAMAYGTATIPAVFKIFGPGNAYVTVAKQLVVRTGVAIDMPAGPSEVMVVADETARPEFVAVDLLSQAEHGADSQVVLLAYSEQMAHAVMDACEHHLETLPRKDFATISLANSTAIVVSDDAHALQLINTYAPEHLILAMDDPDRLVDGIINAGSVFLGHYTPESVGDYASGTNHTLPTNGYARAYSGVSLDSFVKKITFQSLTPQGLAGIAPVVEAMAAAESLEAHRRAVSIRNSGSVPDVDTAFALPVRENIAHLRPYSSARDEFTGVAEVYLDANENPFDNGQNRYPDPHAKAVKQLLRVQKGVPADQMMLGNGSDEIIDLLYRIFCKPGRDEAIVLPPSYGMYQVSADINDVRTIPVPLLPGFVPDTDGILAAVTPHTRLLWLCTPNNPSGNDFPEADIRRLLDHFPGIVVVDEAYIDFTHRASYTTWLSDYPNLVVMQTFSKAWGMAGIRLGMAFASPAIIRLLNTVKPPYNVNQLTQRAALEALQQPMRYLQERDTILSERTRLAAAFQQLDFVLEVYPSDANFLLVRVEAPKELYDYLMRQGIVVRNRSQQHLCEGCLRFTIGTPDENVRLLVAMERFVGVALS